MIRQLLRATPLVLLAGIFGGHQLHGQDPAPALMESLPSGTAYAISLDEAIRRAHQVQPTTVRALKGVNTAEHQKRGIFSIFDPGQSLPAWEPAALAECISRSRMLVCNDYEMEMICSSTGMSREQVAKSVETIVITKGGDGCDLVTSSGIVEIPVVPADDAVDPTGAGDAFRGGLIKGMVEGRSMERAVQMGTVAGHYAVQKWGTQQYSFTMDEFNAKLERHFGP